MTEHTIVFRARAKGIRLAPLSFELLRHQSENFETL